MKLNLTVASLLTEIVLALVILKACASDCPLECRCGNVVGGFISDCSRRGLTYIPNDGEWPEVTMISFSSNNITKIADDSLLGFLSVVELNLEKNQIDNIAVGSFRRLNQLKVLNLQSNMITELRYMDVPSSMNTLFLSMNPLSFSPSSPLPLASGDIEVVALNAVGLETLDLQIISGLSHVSELQAGENLIKHIDLGNFFGLRNLKLLYLSGNMIESITPPPDGVVLRITHLYLSYNRLTYLESNIFKSLENLSYLYLKHNPLIVPPNSNTPFLSHPSLGYLDLSYIYARKITNRTFDLPSLWALEMEGSDVHIIDSAFRDMPLLKGVLLTHNDITQLKADTFAGNRNLQELYLDKNPLIDMDLEELRSAMSGGSESLLDIADTPLACSCAVEEIAYWAVPEKVCVNILCTPRNCNLRRTDFKNNEEGEHWNVSQAEPFGTCPYTMTIKQLKNTLTSPRTFFQTQVESN